MKSKIELVIVTLLAAISSSACSAATSASMPEFRSRADLQTLTPVQHKVKSDSENGEFYTGKPYEEGREAYLFKYRSYDSELSRWTSTDSSGFPDGANAFIYCVNAGFGGVDPDGLSFIHFDGSSLTEYSGSGWKKKGHIDWGEAGDS